MHRRDRAPESKGRLAFGLLIAYSALLCGVAYFGGSSWPWRSIWELQDTAQLMVWAREVALGGTLQFAGFALLGLLVGLSMGATGSASPGSSRAAHDPRVQRSTSRLGRLGRPAWMALTGLLLCILVRAVELRRPPVPAHLLVPCTACLLGIWLGSVWSGDSWRKLAWQVPLLLAALAFGGVGIALLALEREPLPFEPPRVTSAEKRRLVSLVRTSRAPASSVRRLQMSERDVDLLLAWGLSLGSPQRKASVRFRPDASQAIASLGIPLGGNTTRYLNVRATGQLEVREGKVQLSIDGLRVGRVPVPGLIVTPLARMLVSGCVDDPDVRPIVAAVKSLRIDQGRIELVADREVFRSRVAPQLLARLGEKPDVLASARVQLRQLVLLVGDLPPDTDRFEAYVRAAFTLARQRSETADPVLENRAAVYALAILLGHPHVERLVGPVSDAEIRRALGGRIAAAPLRGRGDWTQHFWVGAAIALMSSSTMSNAAGLLKEELDAAPGGSGFSFSDLLAERAGTRFALAATRDERTARLLQQCLSNDDFRIDDVFPPAADLPEGISDAELQRDYGGVGGAGYRKVYRELERRLARCRLLWTQAGKP